MIDKIIGVVVVLLICAVAIVLLFLGIWLTVFCKTLKTMNKMDKEFEREWRRLK